MELKHKVLRGWCIELSRVIDSNREALGESDSEAFDICVSKIKEVLGLLTKEEQQEILQDTDLKGFIESFGEFKKLIKE
jgi:hypothetical protein